MSVLAERIEGNPRPNLEEKWRQSKFDGVILTMIPQIGIYGDFDTFEMLNQFRNPEIDSTIRTLLNPQVGRHDLPVFISCIEQLVTEITPTNRATSDNSDSSYAIISATINSQLEFKRFYLDLLKKVHNGEATKFELHKYGMIKLLYSFAMNTDQLSPTEELNSWEHAKNIVRNSRFRI